MQRKYFFRNFRRYFILFMIPMIILFTVTSFLLQKSTRRDLTQMAERTVSAVNTGMDMVFNSTILQNDQLTNSPYMFLALKKLLNRQQDLTFRDSINLRNISIMMTSIVDAYPGIRSIDIYVKNYEYFYSSHTGITKLMDRQYIDEIREEMEKENVSILFRKSGTGESVSLYRSMFTSNGMIVLNIDINELQDYLSTFLLNENETIYIYDEQGEILFSCNGDRFLEDVSYSEICQYAQDEWVEINGSNFLTDCRDDSRYRLHIVIFTPRNVLVQAVMQYLWICIATFLISSVLILGIVYCSTRKNFQKIEEMVEIFHRAEKGQDVMQTLSGNGDEYDILLNNIVSMFIQDVQRQQEKKEAEMMMLQLQINPHFLFNTLQNLAIVTRRKDKGGDETQEMINALADLLRYALHTPWIPVKLSEEILYLKKYVYLQHQRFGDAFIDYYEIDEELEDCQIFRLILQPIIENSIQHGIKGLNRRGYINVKVWKQEDIMFQITDNGRAMTEERLCLLREEIKEKHFSDRIGLANVNRRLVAYYGEQSALQIQSQEECGTIVSFRIPYKKEIEKRNQEDIYEKKSEVPF